MKSSFPCFASLLLGSTACIAGTAVFSLPSGTSGDQAYGGPLGMDFTVNPGFSILVDSLGAFEDDSNGWDPSTSVVVNIWSRDTNGTPGTFGDDFGIAALTTATLSLSNPGTADGGFRFLSVAPVTLAPGDYTIVAAGFNTFDNNGNTDAGSPLPAPINDGGGAITFVGNSRFGGGAPGTFPEVEDGGPANRYYAGNFAFTVVPEPRVAVLLLGAFALGRRRKGQAAAVPPCGVALT